MKVFLESLYEKATLWSQEAKKLLPIGTRGGLKKSAIQYKMSDLKRIHSEKITQYIEVKLSTYFILFYFFIYLFIIYLFIYIIVTALRL